MTTLNKSTLLLLSSVITSSAIAGEGSYGLGEIIITKGVERTTEAVSTMDVVTAADITESGARNLNEALDLLPGLNVRTGGDGAARIDIRGLRTRQVLLLLDGVPINSNIDGQFDPSTIDVGSIERIKVTRGGASVLYGDGGNAGVINIISKTGSAGLQGRIRAEAGEEGRRFGQLSVGNSGKNWRGFLNLSSYERDHFELSNDYDPVPVTGSVDNFQDTGDRLNSDREDRSISGNLIWTPTLQTEMGISASYREGEYGKPPETRDSTGGDRDDFARTPKFERVDDYEAYSVNLSASHRYNNALTVKPSLYFNRLDELTNNYDDANFNTQVARRALRADNRADIYGANLQVAYEFSAGNLATLATDCRRESWESRGFEIENAGGGGGGGGGTVTNVIDIDEHADVCFMAYEQELQVTDKLGVVAGAGYAKQDRSTGKTEKDGTYRLGAFYDLSDATRLKASHARKIRFPTLRDLFEPGRANPALEPEVTYHYEMGVEHNFTNVPVELGVTLFRIDAEDYIETVNGVAQNTDKSRFKGVEVSTEYSPLDQLTLRGGYTYLDAENRSSGASISDLQNRPEHRFTLELGYHLPGGVSLYTSWLHVENNLELSRDSNPPVRAQETGDYDVVDLKIEKQLGQWTLYSRIHNLMDEDYADSGGFPAPGRWFVIGGELAFGS